MASRLEDRIYGCLLGGLIGDALGAPVEGWTYERILAEHPPAGVTDFEGVGTDDTAIREQLLDALLLCEGHVGCDEFAESFRRFAANYHLWWVPVRNMWHKLASGVTLPVEAGWGNAASSSSAMAIAPMGLINAANPRQAALETFDVAGLIHSGPTGFCRDAACAMAAAVAAAVAPDASVESVLAAAVAYLHPVSAGLMLGEIAGARELARACGGYEAFRAAYYAGHLRPDICDSRETVPVALAIFELAGGEPRAAMLQAANFGRDADTLGTMVGGLCGALWGASGLPAEWVAKVEANPKVRYRELTPALAALVRSRAAAATAHAAAIAALD
jgi:ADP-ribosylglycohydrolase